MRAGTRMTRGRQDTSAFPKNCGSEQPQTMTTTCENRIGLTVRWLAASACTGGLNVKMAGQPVSSDSCRGVTHTPQCETDCPAISLPL